MPRLISPFSLWPLKRRGGISIAADSILHSVSSTGRSLAFLFLYLSSGSRVFAPARRAGTK
jgi:hypothetical protein